MVEEKNQSPEAKKTDLGLDENVEALLAYVLGFVTGIIFYLLEKKNEYVRFHTMQSIATFAGIFVISTVLNIVPILGPILGMLLNLGGIILWIILMIKAYQGERIKLPIVGDIAEKYAKAKE